MSVGENIAYYRKKAGYSQRTLGKEIGVSQTMICYYENYGKSVPYETIEKLIKVLGCRKKDLLGNTTIKKKPVKAKKEPDLQEMIRKEKEIMFEDMSGWQLLAYSIIEENRFSYIKALRTLKKIPDDYESRLEARLCEQFFREEFPGFVNADIDGDAVISALRRFANSNKRLTKIRFEPGKRGRHELQM